MLKARRAIPLMELEPLLPKLSELQPLAVSNAQANAAGK
jgi:hypothetical protein